MSTRWAGVVVLALVGVSAGAAERDGVYVEDRRAPVDIEGVLAPRKLATEPTPDDIGHTAGGGHSECVIAGKAFNSQ